MDKEFIRELLFTEDGTSDKLIKDGDFIDSELLGMLKKASRKNQQKAFYLYKERGYKQQLQYLVELECPACGYSHKKYVSKTKLMQVLGYSNTYSSGEYLCYCEKCEAEKKAKDREEEKRQNKIYQEKVQIKAQIRKRQYIEDYLDPNKIFNEGILANAKIDKIMGSFYGYDFDEEIKKAIQNMDYADFLKTPYWDGVRNYKLKRAKYSCQLCGGKEILNVHHKTYENHGREHIRQIADNDLIVLCKTCHEKFHDKFHKNS